MSAIVPARGDIRQLDKAAEPDEQIQPDDVADAPRLVRLLMRMLRDLTTVRRRWWPQSLDFEDVTVDATGTVTYRLTHQFGGRARFWPVEWVGAAAPNLRRHASSDNNTLVLTSTSAGLATIRVEEAG